MISSQTPMPVIAPKSRQPLCQKSGLLVHTLRDPIIPYQESQVAQRVPPEKKTMQYDRYTEIALMWKGIARALLFPSTKHRKALPRRIFSAQNGQ